jgi:hypothetical protein
MKSKFVKTVECLIINCFCYESRLNGSKSNQIFQKELSRPSFEAVISELHKSTPPGSCFEGNIYCAFLCKAIVRTCYVISIISLNSCLKEVRLNANCTLRASEIYSFWKISGMSGPEM